MSRNRNTPDDAERLSHFAKILSIATSSNISTLQITRGAVDPLAPEIGRGYRGADDLLAYHSPELADFSLHLRGFAAQHLEDQAGTVGQTTSPECNPVRKVDIGPRTLVDTVCLVLGRAQDHVGERVKGVHHAGLPHRISPRLDDQLLCE